MTNRPLMLRIGYDRMEDEHRRAAEARLARDLPEATGRQRVAPRVTQAVAASAARAARALRTGHHRATTARPG